jgi:hypothetical protein
MANPESVLYSIGKTIAGNPCVVVTTQEVDWDAKPIGEASQRAITIQDIEQLVGFCVRCGNQELLQAVQRSLSRGGANI